MQFVVDWFCYIFAHNQWGEGFSTGAVMRKVRFSDSSMWKTGLSCQCFGQSTLTSSPWRRSEYSDWNVSRTNLSFTHWNQRTQPCSQSICLLRKEVSWKLWDGDSNICMPTILSAFFAMYSPCWICSQVRYTWKLVKMATVLHLLKTLYIVLVYICMNWEWFRNKEQSFLRNMNQSGSQQPCRGRS